MKLLCLAAVLGLTLMSASFLKAQERDSTQNCSDPSPHEVSFVMVAPNVKLEVLDWGGAGNPLVFLHGISMNAHAFDYFAPRFTDTHRVIGITRRGHGASSWPDSGYSKKRRVEDIRLVLDSLDLERVIFAGHSLAGKEITHFATKYPARVTGLIYIDAAHDLTLIRRLRLPQVCPMGPEAMKAIERQFENLEAFRHTQKRKGDDGTLQPYVSNAAIKQIMAGQSSPDYSAVRAPALAVYHVPKRVEGVLGGIALPDECVSALQRYIYRSIAQFAQGMKNARIVAIQDGQHNLHLAAPDELETAMKRWLMKLNNKQ